MARRLDGSTGGESLAGPRLRAFFIYPPRSGAEAEGGCRKIAGVCPRGYWQCGGANPNRNLYRRHYAAFCGGAFFGGDWKEISIPSHFIAVELAPCGGSEG